MVDWGGLENRCPCKRTVGSNPTLSAIILIRINEMAYRQAKIPQYSWGFADGDRTSETGGTAKTGLRSAFVSFHPNLVQKGSD